jgi:hypothetical protein
MHPLQDPSTPSIDSITSIQTKGEYQAFLRGQAGLDDTEAGGECPISQPTDASTGTAKSVISTPPPTVQRFLPPTSTTSK